MASTRSRRDDSVNAVFGDALPQSSTDERDDGSPEHDVERDQWLRDNTPPHHR